MSISLSNTASQPPAGRTTTMSPAAGCKTTRHSTRRGASWRDCYTAGVTVSLLLLCATPALQQRYLTEDSTSSSSPPDALALGIDTRTWKLRIRPRLFQIGQQRMSAGLRNLLLPIAIPVIKLTVTVVLVFYIAGEFLELPSNIASGDASTHI